MTSTPSSKAASVSQGVDAVARNEALKTYTSAVRSGATPRSAMDDALRKYLSRITPSLSAAVPERGGAATACPSCKGEGCEADWVGDDMRCVAVACSACNGTGRALTPAPTPVEAGGELPVIPDDDADFTPDLARKIIAGYQRLLLAKPASEPAGGVREALEWVERQIRAAKQAMKDSAELGNGYANFAAHDAHKHLKTIARALSAPASSSPAEAEAKEDRT